MLIYLRQMNSYNVVLDRTPSLDASDPGLQILVYLLSSKSSCKLSVEYRYMYELRIVLCYALEVPY